MEKKFEFEQTHRIYRFEIDKNLRLLFSYLSQINNHSGQSVVQHKELKR